jgi:hypothetical protein
MASGKKLVTELVLYKVHTPLGRNQVQENIINPFRSAECPLGPITSFRPYFNIIAWIIKFPAHTFEGTESRTSLARLGCFL